MNLGENQRCLEFFTKVGLDRIPVIGSLKIMTEHGQTTGMCFDDPITDVNGRKLIYNSEQRKGWNEHFITV